VETPTVIGFAPESEWGEGGCLRSPPPEVAVEEADGEGVFSSRELAAASANRQCEVML